MTRLGTTADLYFPFDLLDEYKTMTVDAGGTLVRVGLNRYRCRRPAYGGTADAEEVKDGFLGASKSKIIAEAGGAVPLVDVFVGKGSPEQVALVLGLMYKYREPFVKFYARAQGPRGTCAKLLAANEGDPGAMLQAVCDAFLGVDCNGFVGNYAKTVRPKLFGPNTPIKSYFDRRVALRTKAEDVELFDVIVWADYSHIAIVDSFIEFVGEEAGVVVAQSTAGGPQVGTFRFVRSGPGLFRLTPSGRVGGSVRVVSLGLTEQG